jgi:hypothetical protein
MQTPLLNALLPHGLTDFEISEVAAELRNFRAVSQAWLVRKQLDTIRSRPVFLLLAEMDGLGEEEGDALGAQIRRSGAARQALRHAGAAGCYARRYGTPGRQTRVSARLCWLDMACAKQVQARDSLPGASWLT